MTDTTTADVFAADLIASTYKLAVWHSETWNCAGLMRTGCGKTRISAVRAWAEAAGVPWPIVNVVPMFAVVDGDEIIQMTLTEEDARKSREFWRSWRVVPCEVVIRNKTEGV